MPGHYSVRVQGRDAHVDAALVPTPPRRGSFQPQRLRRTGRRIVGRFVRAAEVAAVALGTALGASGGGEWTATAIGVAVLITLSVSPRYHRRLTISVLDCLPLTVVLVGVPTIVTAAGWYIVWGREAYALGALRAGVIILSTLLIGQVVAFAVVQQLRRHGIGLLNTMIVGYGEIGNRLGWSLVDDSSHGLQLAGFIDEGLAPVADPGPLLGPVDELRELIHRHEIDIVVLAFDSRPCRAVIDAIRQIGRQRCEIYLVPRLVELYNYARDREIVHGIPLVRLYRPAFRAASWPLKRLLDVTAVTFALLPLLPVFAATALAVRWETGPGVIFRQQRIGLDGRPFTLYKFRSLKPVSNEGDTQWNIDSDPRLGPVGRFIRATSLDELPQLVNVLKGDMSLVGPRPERPFYVEQFNETVPGYRYRHRMPAGLTGFAVVHGLHGDTSILERSRFDNIYAESWSLWLDMKIIIRTASRVFSAIGRRMIRRVGTEGDVANGDVVNGKKG